MAYVGGGLVVGGPVYPFLVVTCSQCGYTVFVNALKAGILKPPQGAVSPDPTQEEGVPPLRASN
jgi:hypothetical protein